MAKTAQTRVAMYNLNLLSNDNIPEDGEEREDGWEGRCSIDDEKWNVVDFEAIRQISHSSPPVVCMSDDYDFVPSINELRRQLVDVRFDSSGLGKKEVADHRNVVRHGGQTNTLLASRQIPQMWCQRRKFIAFIESKCKPMLLLSLSLFCVARFSRRG
jgi:hypothetical protein